jgi:GTP-binding protein
MKRTDLRNLAIIAHVDHGKTTLVDQMLRQSGQFRKEELDKLVGGQHGLILDSNDLERERGITILAKNIAINIGGVKVNLIDTPGHADFGGEVERVLKMADGALLLVDAAEGPLPQTRFVLRKAFANKLRPIVVINKIDRADARPQQILNDVFDLFIELEADEATLEFPVVYASGRAGIATRDLKQEAKDLRPLFDLILEHVPPPEVEPDQPLQILVTNLDHNDYLGRIAVGPIVAGKIRKGQRVTVMGHNQQHNDTVSQLFVFDRLGRAEAQEVDAGDIVAIAGLDNVEIGDTIADPDQPKALPPIRVDDPTLTMLFRINDSPFSGRDGDYLTSRQLRDRLMKELERNVALRVESEAGRMDEFKVSGRGLLHLGILLETMRRESYELSVGKPVVIMREENGQKLEPIEYLVVEVPAGSIGPVMELLGSRRAECLKLDSRGEMSHMEFIIPARGLIGLRTRLLNATSGQAVMHHNFYDYQPVKGVIPARINGVMVSTETGMATAHAIENLQERGILFVAPGDEVYEGQIVGEHCRDNDLPVNICREKKLTNMRAATSEKTIPLKAPRRFSLEAALEYIEDDEYVEVTPNHIRLRKAFLKEADRKRQARQEAKG